MADAKHTDTCEWQASPNGGAWRRIEPPAGETLQQRIDYLLAYRRGDGSPAYRVRRMVAETPLTVAASDLLAALQVLVSAYDPEDNFSELEVARAAIGKAAGSAS